MAEGPVSIFPQNITVEDCRAAIKGAPGFREAKKGDYLLFNYGTVDLYTAPLSNVQISPLLQIMLFWAASRTQIPLLRPRRSAACKLEGTNLFRLSMSSDFAPFIVFWSDFSAPFCVLGFFWFAVRVHLSLCSVSL